MAKKQEKQKKMNVRVDFTPMVDMMMLLITFFMLCTSLAKPQSMELSMPANDKNLEDEDKSVTKAHFRILCVLIFLYKQFANEFHSLYSLSVVIIKISPENLNVKIFGELCVFIVIKMFWGVG